MPGTGRLRFIEVKGRVSGAANILVARNEIPYQHFLNVAQFLRCPRCHLLSPGCIALSDDEVAAVLEQQGAVQDTVVCFRIKIVALGHDPIFVVAQEQVLARLVEERSLASGYSDQPRRCRLPERAVFLQ